MRKNDPWDAYKALLEREPQRFQNDARGGYQIVTEDAAAKQIQTETQDALAERGHQRSWGTVGLVFEDKYLRIIRDAVIRPDGSRGTYFRLLPGSLLGDGVAILPIFEGKIVMLRHFRHAVRGWRIEIPRGFSNVRQSAEENAKREVMEEIGGEVASIESLGIFETDTGMCSHRTEMFCCWMNFIGEASEKKEAIAEIFCYESSDIEKQIADGILTDSFSIIAFARAKTRGII